MINLHRIPDRITLLTQEGSIQHAGDFLVKSPAAILQCDLQADRLHILLTGFETPLYSVRLRWNIKLPERLQLLGDHWERGYGDLSWRGYVPERVMPWYFIAAAEGGRTAGCGVMVQPDALAFWQVDPSGVTLTLDVRCGGEGVTLGGKTIAAATVRCGCWQDITPYEAAEHTAAMLCERPLHPDHPVYGANNWYYAYGRSSAAEIRSDAAGLARLTQGLANRPYMLLDDCWQQDRIPDAGYNGGPWRMGNGLFPDMKRLAEEIAAQDVRPGIWWRPLQNRDPQIPQEWRLAHSDFVIDPTVPEALEWIAEDQRTLVRWGYRLLKHDFSTYDLTGQWGMTMGGDVSARVAWRFHDRSLTTAMIIKRLYQTLHDNKGEAMILGCNVVGHLAAGLVEINRTGDDTSGREWERTRKMGVNTLAFRMPQHRRFFDVDADCVGIMGDIPWEKNRQWLDLLAHSGTPLFVSMKPGVLNAAQEGELADAYAVASLQHNTAVPLDWMHTTCPAEWRIDGRKVRYDWYDAAGIEPQR